jgi:hypothetical protein
VRLKLLLDKSIVPPLSRCLVLTLDEFEVLQILLLRNVVKTLKQFEPNVILFIFE